MVPRLMVLGGAWDWDDALNMGKAAGIEHALVKGYQILLAGGSALDAVEVAVRVLEDDASFEAGRGGFLNENGVVQLDALVVDGATLNFAAVACVTQTSNPVSLARGALEKSDHCFLFGADADRLVEDLCLPKIENPKLATDAMRERYNGREADVSHGTAGAVAMDLDGNLACATSSSGAPSKPARRVGDWAIYGASGYAENGCAAAVATGNGEHMEKSLFSKHVCDQVYFGQDAVTAARAGMRRFEMLFPSSMSGVIIIDRHGNLGAAHTAPKMAFGWIDTSGVARVSMSAADFGYGVVPTFFPL